MNLVEIILLAMALGIDCFTVSFSQGLLSESNKFKNSILLALTMGFFQWFMPFIGYFGTNIIESYIEPFAKWIVFAIFMFLGIKFIYESFNSKEEKEIVINFICLISLGIATSIDAFASGINIKLSNTPLLFATFIIGISSFMLSIGGSLTAIFFKKLPYFKSFEILGGLILIALAVKALL